MKKRLKQILSFALALTVVISSLTALVLVTNAADPLFCPVGSIGMSTNRGFGNSHYAVDIAQGREGATVYSAVSGTVVFDPECSAGNGSHELVYENGYKIVKCYNNKNCCGFGKGVMIKGDDGRFYHYCHMSQNSVNNGQRVTKGQVIGKVGNTGYSFGAHLHFAISNQMWGSYVNPLNYTYSTTIVSSATTPTFKTEGYEGGVKVTLTAGSGETIYYGIGNNSCPNKYTGPFNVTSTQQVYAVSKASGKTDAKKDQKITVNKTATPGIEVIPTSSNYSVKISAEVGASIYYTLDGTTPTTSSSKYVNAIPLTQNATVKAIAVKSGSALSDVATQQVTIAAPAMPSIRLESNAKIPVGDYAYVSWNTDGSATEYVATLYDSNSNQVASKTTENTSEKFLLSKVGKYKIDVKARNFIGDSEKSLPAVNVEAMPDCIVTFKNGVTGETISTQKVKYGYSATTPANPTQEGYDFTAWDVTNLNNITENKTVTALFKIKTYSVKFCDLNGDVIKSETVEWHKSATPPTAPTAPLGKTFAGWTVTSYDKGYDYKSVDGNMSFIPSYKWADDKLDVAVEITSATRNNNGNAYDVTVNVVANDSRASNTKLIIALVADGTNSNGESITDKLVKAQTTEVQLNAGSVTTKTITVNTSEKATKVKVYAVGYDNSYEITGGAQSLVAEAPVTATTAWSDWSDWTVENNESVIPGDKESKKQYRSRDKVFSDWTTATAMDGYTQVSGTEGTRTVYGDWGSWSGWSTTKQTSSDTMEVNTRTVYVYMHWCNNAGGIAPSNGYTNGKYGPHYYKSTTNLGYDRIGSTGDKIKDKLGGCQYGETSYYYRGTETQYSYRTRTKTIEYKYEKWGNWTAWQDSPIASTDNIEVRTRTVNRYRTKVETSDPAAGVVNVNGTKYTKSGKLNIDVDVSGLYATVMVYKGKNGDPTSSAIEYVGQIKIGSGNTWSVSFVPREEISESTGDYYITLGVEGISSLITVDTIYYTKEKNITYTVNFYNYDGTILKTQDVAAGSDAVAPANPTVTGKTFIGWDTALKNISKDTEVVARFADNTYSVVYVNWITQNIDVISCKYGDKIELPEAANVEGYTFVKWNNTSNTVNGNMVIEAVYTKNEYTVTFLNQDGSTFTTQKVKYGEAANLPGACKTRTGYKFVDWSNETTWYNVTENITVKPITEFSLTALTPVLAVTPNLQTYENKYIDEVEIEVTVEPETKAMYKVDRAVDLGRSGDSDEWMELEGNTITLYSDATVFVKAIGDNMNDSGIAEYSVEVMPYDEYESTLPVVTAIPENSNYNVGEKSATLVMRIDNPENRTIIEWGCLVTEVVDGESIGETYEIVNNEIGNSLTYPLGRAFDVDNLKPGTTYSYYFYASTGDGYYSSDICTFTTSYHIDANGDMICDTCGDSMEDHICDFKEVITKAPTCTQSGVATLTCICGKTNGTKVIPATGHTDKNKDGVCDTCKTAINKPSNISKVVISAPKSKTVDYRNKVKMTATAKDMPKGYYIQWFDGNKAVGEKGESSAIYTTEELKSAKTFTAKIVDANGKVVSATSQEKQIKIDVNAGFFKKLIAFFRSIFGGQPTIVVKP